MYELFIANKNYSSWSLRPWVLLHELGIPFRETLVPFGGQQNPDAFRTFSPTGKVPCLVDGTTTVWDSLSITEYLAERHAGVWPAEAVARAWARSAAAEMHSGFQTLRTTCGMNCGIRVQLHSIEAPLKRDLGRIEELWADGIGRHGGPWLTGARFCAVDAFFAPVAFRIQTCDLPIGAAARRYAAQLLALPAMQRWYAAALAETWRDEEHDLEARVAGVWLSDLRAK
ncbi:MAG TPA: glutathione S-transferase family protein [Steroidobacteraceae bacterium]|nr:glutathione S-transferase family protein [Steroidobacteraceae bacterium]